MQRVTFLVPRQRSQALGALLQDLKLVHLEGTPHGLDEAQDFESLDMPAQAAEAKLKQLAFIQGVLDEFAPLKRGFLASLVSVPMQVSREEMRRAVEVLDVAALHEQCHRASEQFRQAARRIEAAESEVAELSFFARLGLDVTAARSLRRMRVWVGALRDEKLELLQADAWAAEHVALQVLLRQDHDVYVCAVAAESEAEGAARVLDACGFAERRLPALEAPLAERLADLRREVEEWKSQQGQARASVVALAAARRQVMVATAYWQGELARVQALNRGIASRRVSVFTGYARARDLHQLRSAMARDLPDVSIIVEEPGPDEQVPVSLSLNPVLKPMRFLVRMFGLPDYFSFDPTPYLSLVFLLFFGFCYGDVIYGAMLCAVAGYLGWKSRKHEMLNELPMLFLYGGISAMVVGTLTGSWAGDLWQAKYLGEGNLLLRIKERTTLIDPMERPMLMLMVALGVGVATQFYGIVLKGYSLLRRGDVVGALLDGGLWLLMLPAFLICASKLFFPTPAWLFRLGLWVSAIVGTGLVLSQGRSEPSLPGKIVTGLVSLYGILGGYGCMSFVGDMLSYSRLLALGLTTSIIGLSFNIMAGLVRDVPHVGLALFAIVLVVGHVFNFLMGILGGFVHSARLIFLEFFSRFYGGNGVSFRPLSFDTGKVFVTGP
jgi:V/A-type H+-transporting ATPase subunit I